jgi:hypothetical protein
MPEISFKAFLSCSLDSEDREIVDFFRGIIRGFDIDPQVYDYQEIGRLPDNIKERIINADCLIAIATRRQKIEGSNDWACPDWIHHEVALANAYQKPIAIFFEDGVKLEGLIAAEQRRERFCRGDLLCNVHKLVRFLFNLRAHLESTYRSEKLHIPVLLRHYLHIKEEIRSKELAVLRCEVLMECLADELSATHHLTELDESTPGLSVRPREFSFVPKELPYGTTASAVVMQDSDSKHLWRVVFSPPLKKGDKAKYAFKIVSQNTRPFTFEELMERISHRTYEYTDPICEACEWSIAYPTAEFFWDIEFPEGYEIADYYVDVTMSDAELKAENEVRRIKEGKMFSAEKIIDKWSMSLRIPKPIQDHTYYVYYVPPRSSA